MELMDIAALLSRGLHLVFAAIAVGGVAMTRFALAPAAKEVSGTEVAKYRDAVRRRWMKWVMAAIGFLLFSGIMNFVVVHGSFKGVGDGEMPKWYHAVFGTKFLLAMAVFYISSLLVGKSESAQRARQNEMRWLTINFVLMVAIICLAGVLRLAHNAPTPADVSFLCGGGIYG
jgi:putative copper export protein